MPMTKLDMLQIRQKLEITGVYTRLKKDFMVCGNDDDFVALLVAMLRIWEVFLYLIYLERVITQLNLFHLLQDQQRQFQIRMLVLFDQEEIKNQLFLF